MKDKAIEPQGPSVMESAQDAQAPQDENPAAAEQNPGGPPPRLPRDTAPGKSAKNEKPIPRAKK